MGIFYWDFDNANGQLKVAEDSWVFAAIAVPLTILTLGIAYGWMWFGDRNSDRTIGLLFGDERDGGRGVALRTVTRL